MPRAYSGDMRQRLIAEVESGASRRAAAEEFAVSASTAIIWVKCFRETGRCAAKPRGGSISPLEEHVRGGNLRRDNPAALSTGIALVLRFRFVEACFACDIGTLLYFGVKIEPVDRTVTQSSARRCITYRNGRAPNGHLRARTRAERLRISGFDKRPRSRNTHLRCDGREHDNCGLCCHYCERVSGIVGNRSSDATHMSSPRNPQTERLLSRCSFGPFQFLSFFRRGFSG